MHIYQTPKINKGKKGNRLITNLTKSVSDERKSTGQLDNRLLKNEDIIL